MRRGEGEGAIFLVSHQKILDISVYYLIRKKGFYLSQSVKDE